MLSCVLALTIWWKVDPRSGAPAIESLVRLEGAVASVEAGRKRVSFRVKGYPNRIRFGSKGGGLRVVERALNEAISRGGIAVALVDRREFRPFVVGDATVTAYELAIDGRMIRSWHETDAAYRRNNRLAPWLVGSLAIGGAALLVHAARMGEESAA